MVKLAMVVDMFAGITKWGGLQNATLWLATASAIACTWKRKANLAIISALLRTCMCSRAHFCQTAVGLLELKLGAHGSCNKTMNPHPQGSRADDQGVEY